jgi:hypothetical protein
MTSLARRGPCRGPQSEDYGRRPESREMSLKLSLAPRSRTITLRVVGGRILYVYCAHVDTDGLKWTTDS